MNSIAAPSQQYVKARLELEKARQALIDAAHTAHKHNDLKTALRLFDDVLELDAQLIGVSA